MENITAQVNLGKLVQAYPLAAEYLLQEWGLHCVNCFANQFDTLEDGMRLHGYTNEQIQQAVEGLCALALQSPSGFDILKAND